MSELALFVIGTFVFCLAFLGSLCSAYLLVTARFEDDHIALDGAGIAPLAEPA